MNKKLVFSVIFLFAVSCLLALRNSNQQVLSSTDDSNLTLLFGGDIMLARSVNTQMIKRKDSSWPVAKIKSLTNKPDLFIANLESPFGESCKATEGGMVFCADPKSLSSLTSAGVDVVTLANNHIYNQGQKGLDLTKNLLAKNNIAYTGISGHTSIVTVKNLKIGFLGFNEIPPHPSAINKLTSQSLTAEISALRPQVDLLFVLPHWGNEYSQRSVHQQQLAHLAIDLGADAVIGSHPHWVQENETYKDKPIYYSLGNLIFDQMWSEETRKGLLVRLTYDGKTLLNQEHLPIKIFNYGQPAIEGQSNFRIQ